MSLQLKQTKSLNYSLLEILDHRFGKNLLDKKIGEWIIYNF